MSEQFKNFKRRYKCANCGFVADYFTIVTVKKCVKCGSNALDEV